MKAKRQTNIASILIGVFMAIVIVSFTSFAEAQSAADRRPGSMAFGAAMGFQSGTPDDTALALGFYGDFYLTRDFSVGPLLQMGFTDDLFQFGLTAQAKYTFGIADIPQLKPHVQAGFGFIYADLDKSAWRNQDDTSFLIPIGIGAEYKLTDAILLDTSFIFNFTDLDVRDENFFFTWLIGFKSYF